MVDELYSAVGMASGITLCPLCGGTMRVIADITDPDVIEKILDHIEAQPPPDKSAAANQS